MKKVIFALIVFIFFSGAVAGVCSAGLGEYKESECVLCRTTIYEWIELTRKPIRRLLPKCPGKMAYYIWWEREIPVCGECFEKSYPEFFNLLEDVSMMWLKEKIKELAPLRKQNKEKAIEEAIEGHKIDIEILEKELQQLKKEEKKEEKLEEEKIELKEEGWLGTIR